MRRRLSAGKYLQSSKHILEKHKKLRAAVSAPTASFQISDGIELSVSLNTSRWFEDFGRRLSRAKSGRLTRLLSDWPFRATAVHAVLPRIQLLIISVYAPQKGNGQGLFFKQLDAAIGATLERLHDTADHREVCVIMGGDWNKVERPEIDSQPPPARLPGTPRAVKTLQALTARYQLIDAYRTLRPTCNAGANNDPGKKGGAARRLDRFYVSTSLTSDLQTVEVRTRVQGSHHPVVLHFDVHGTIPTGSDWWKIPRDFFHYPGRQTTMEGLLQRTWDEARAEGLRPSYAWNCAIDEAKRAAQGVTRSIAAHNRKFNIHDPIRAYEGKCIRAQLPIEEATRVGVAQRTRKRLQDVTIEKLLMPTGPDNTPIETGDPEAMLRGARLFFANLFGQTSLGGQ
jgi:hypothetical protein